jgi:hypothetical protein
MNDCLGGQASLFCLPPGPEPNHNIVSIEVELAIDAVERDTECLDDELETRSSDLLSTAPCP